MNNVRFSIIIPAYNAEKYITNTLNSIYNQSYKNYEIIVVDDCSTDSTYEILKNKKSLKIYQTPENSRQGAARNIGLDNAEGEYILFLDSDDEFYSNKALEVLDEKIRKEKDIDLIYTGLKITGNRELEIIPNEENIKKEIRLGKYKWINCTTICIKRQLIEENKIRFPEKIRYEDVLFAFVVIEKAKKVDFIKDITYLYINREQSTTTKYSFEQGIDTIKLIKELVELKDIIDKENIVYLKKRIQEQQERLSVRIQRAIDTKL